MRPAGTRAASRQRYRDRERNTLTRRRAALRIIRMLKERTMAQPGLRHGAERTHFEVHLARNYR